MPKLPPLPSFSGLRSSRPAEAQSTTSIVVDVALAGMEATTPFLGSVPRLTIGLVDKRTDEKYQKLRGLCERFICLHTMGKKATERGDGVTEQWWTSFVELQKQFELFAEGYEERRRILWYMTLKIRPVNDQQARTYFTECLDCMFMHLLLLGQERDADGEERARTDSESTVASSP